MTIFLTYNFILLMTYDITNDLTNKLNNVTTRTMTMREPNRCTNDSQFMFSNQRTEQFDLGSSYFWTIIEQDTQFWNFGLNFF